jgi:plasmid stability protein
MTDLPIDDDVIEALRIIAEREGQSTEELANALLRRYVMTEHSTSRGAAAKDPFLLIAQAADNLGLSSHEGDIAERSREILTEEYASYLIQRRDQPINNGESND